ncbi:organic hydroperoxide resistance protein, partial [Rhodospirillum rubrum]
PRPAPITQERPMTIAYRTKATAVGGREGRATSEDGLLDVALALPKELGGPGKATNPEQLFAAGYAACFESALRHVARGRKLALASTTVTAEVGIGPRADKGFSLEVALDITLGGVDQATAEDVVAEAHEVCPYSHATRGNIPVTLQVHTA